MMTFAQWSTSNCYLFYGLKSLFAGNRFALTMYAAKTQGPRKRERIEGPWSESHNSWRAEWRILRPWKCALCQEYATERKSFTIVAIIFTIRGPSTWALVSGCPPLFSLILLSVSEHLSLTAIGHWLSLEIHVRGPERSQTHPPVQYLNNRSHGQYLR